MQFSKINYKAQNNNKIALVFIIDILITYLNIFYKCLLYNLYNKKTDYKIIIKTIKYTIYKLIIFHNLL